MEHINTIIGCLEAKPPDFSTLGHVEDNDIGNEARAWATLISDLLAHHRGGDAEDHHVHFTDAEYGAFEARLEPIKNQTNNDGF